MVRNGWGSALSRPHARHAARTLEIDWTSRGERRAGLTFVTLLPAMVTVGEAPRLSTKRAVSLVTGAKISMALTNVF